MERHAQTNLQLYAQLRKAGYDEEAITSIRRGYGLATRLFAGRYRASEKPFVDHLVGTASVLVSIQARPALILAALLHAAYVQGDFGDGPLGGRTPEHVSCLRSTLGEEAERLVAEYTRFPWSAGDLAGRAEAPQPITEGQKDLVLMRLANEIDDLTDQGVLYYANGERRRTEALNAAPAWIAWAKQLSPDLAAALAGALEELRSARVSPALKAEASQSFNPETPLGGVLWKRALRRFRGRRATNAFRM